MQTATPARTPVRSTPARTLSRTAHTPLATPSSSARPTVARALRFDGTLNANKENADRSLKEEISRLLVQQSDLQERLATSRRQNAQLNQKMTSMISENASLVSQLREKTNAFNQVCNEQERAQLDADRRDGTIRAMPTRPVSHASDTVTSSQVSRLQQQVTSLQHKLATAAAEVTRLQANERNATLQARVDELEAEVATLKGRVESQSGELNEQVVQIEKLSALISKLKGEEFEDEELQEEQGAWLTDADGEAAEVKLEQGRLSYLCLRARARQLETSRAEQLAFYERRIADERNRTELSMRELGNVWQRKVTTLTRENEALSHEVHFLTIKSENMQQQWTMERTNATPSATAESTSRSKPVFHEVDQRTKWRVSRVDGANASTCEDEEDDSDDSEDSEDSDDSDDSDDFDSDDADEGDEEVASMAKGQMPAVAEHASSARDAIYILSDDDQDEESDSDDDEDDDAFVQFRVGTVPAEVSFRTRLH